MKYKTIALAVAVAALLPSISLAFVTASDSSGTIPNPGNLPCQAEMKALMAKFQPTISSTTPTSTPQAPATLGTLDVSSMLANMNTPEGKALQNCLAANLPTGGPGSPIPAGASIGAQASSTGSADIHANAGATTSGSCPVIARNLARGSRGTDVSVLQNYFVSLSLLSSDSATGFFGNLTVAATKSWQTSHGLDAVGLVGPRTRAALAKCGQ